MSHRPYRFNSGTLELSPRLPCWSWNLEITDLPPPRQEGAGGLYIAPASVPNVTLAIACTCISVLRPWNNLRGGTGGSVK